MKGANVYPVINGVPLKYRVLEWSKCAALWCVWLVLRIIAAFRPHKRFRPKGVDYLDRWYYTPTGKGRFAKWYRRKYPGVFLHCFLASDPDRGWHSHPWWTADSRILKGRYLESRPVFRIPDRWVDHWRVFREGDKNQLRAGDFHKVKLVTKKVWTLFVVGPLHGDEWGFLDEQGHYTPHGTDTPGD